MSYETQDDRQLADARIAELEEVNATLEAENALLRERCLAADEAAGYLIELARLSMFGVNGTGENATAPRIIMEWARGQIEAMPEAENYYSVAFEHAMAPDIAVVVCIQRRDKETPASRAARLQAELKQAHADARALACQWRAVDDTEDLQFFGACWREAHPGRDESDLGRDPSMSDLVAALRRVLGGA